MKWFKNYKEKKRLAKKEQEYKQEIIDRFWNESDLDATLKLMEGKIQVRNDELPIYNSRITVILAKEIKDLKEKMKQLTGQ